MPQISIPVAADGIRHASHRLSREVERLEAAGKRIRNIHYPASFAQALGIARGRDSAFYRGYSALASDVVPPAIVIECENLPRSRRD
jgi:hypothetical protein